MNINCDSLRYASRFMDQFSLPPHRITIDTDDCIQAMWDGVYGTYTFTVDPEGYGHVTYCGIDGSLSCGQLHDRHDCPGRVTDLLNACLQYEYNQALKIAREAVFKSPGC